MAYGDYISRELCRTPSSTKYRVDFTNKNKAPNYSMRPKTKMINKTMTIEAQNSNPGPGNYDNPEISSQSHFSSKFATISYGTSKTQRFQTESTHRLTQKPGHQARAPTTKSPTCPMWASISFLAPEAEPMLNLTSASEFLSSMKRQREASWSLGLGPIRLPRSLANMMEVYIEILQL